MSVTKPVVSLCRTQDGRTLASRPSPSGAAAVLTQAFLRPSFSRGQRRNKVMVFATALAMMIFTNPLHAGTWQPMTMEELPITGDTNQFLQAWPDAIAEVKATPKPTSIQIKKPDTIWTNFQTFTMDGQTYTASITLNKQCDNGANNFNSGIERSLCEVRITNSQNKVVAKAPACYSDPPDEQTPEANRTDQTDMQFDPATRKLRFQTSVGGKFVKECSTEIDLAGVR